MNNKIKIAIADDHTLVCQSFAKTLSAEDNFEVVGTAPNGLDLLKIVEEKKPDVVLLDLEMPVMNGWETLAHLKINKIATMVVIVSMHFEDLNIVDMVDLGARGFLPKNSDFQTLIGAINEVHSSGYYFNKKISKSVVKNLITTKAINPQFNTVVLTDKEKETLELICNDKLTWEIAEELKVTERTAERYKTALLQKTDAKSTAGLVLFAIRNNYIKI